MLFQIGSNRWMKGLLRTKNTRCHDGKHCRQAEFGISASGVERRVLLPEVGMVDACGCQSPNNTSVPGI